MPGESSANGMVPLPEQGRVYRQQRRVHLADASPGGRLRLDAFARFLQDISNEDTRASGFSEVMGWVVRRTVVDVAVDARFGEQLTLATWCSGTGLCWAERRVAVTGDAGAHIDAATLWVHIDIETGRPRRLPDAFYATFGAAAAGRTVRPRLQLPADATGAAPPRVWPLRFADFDVLGHMNNAVAWVAVEEELAGRRDLRAPLRAVVEFPHELGRDVEVILRAEHGDAHLALSLGGPSGAHVLADVRSSGAAP